MTSDARKEFFACLALRHTPGVGPRTWKAVLDHYGSAFEGLADAASWPGLRLANKRQAEACRREVWRTAAEVEYRAANTWRMQILPFTDPRFPDRLREIPDPPVLLYFDGDPSLLAAPAVAVVGARKCTDMGLAAARTISEELSKAGVAIISGLAQGIDRQAHLGGLSGIGSSVAVLGTGLDIPYPAQNRDVRRELRERGLIVSEFAPGIGADPKNFPFRNRIISGLSHGVLVAEAAHRSGSLITARLAGEQGREVFALPGPLGTPTFTGCHRLLKDGATLVETADDVLASLRYQFGQHLGELAGIRRETADAERGVGYGPEPASWETERKKSSPSASRLHVSLAIAPEKVVTPRPAPSRAEPPQLDEEERAVFGVLDGGEKVHIDAVGRALDWDSARVSRVLLVLELRGMVRQWPGMYYSEA